MIKVNWWLDDEFPDRLSWNCFVVDEPETNYTGRPFEVMQAELVRVYNDKHLASLTVDDFTWNEIAKPPPIN